MVGGEVLLERRVVVGGGGTSSESCDGEGVLYGGNGAGETRGENLVCRSEFEVFEVHTPPITPRPVNTSNTSNPLRRTRYSPRIPPAPLPPHNIPPPSILPTNIPPLPTTQRPSNMYVCMYTVMNEDPSDWFD